MIEKRKAKSILTSERRKAKKRKAESKLTSDRRKAKSEKQTNFSLLTFANSADPDVTARDESSHQDLHCLPFFIDF